MKDVVLHIEGMSCVHCLNAVNRALGQVKGAETQSVQIGRAVVRYDEGATGPAALVAAIEDAGFRATPAEPTTAG